MELPDIGYLREKKPRMLLGFPGFGMAGSIALQYFIENANVEFKGRLDFEAPQFSFIAVHEGNIVWPVSLYYANEQNVLLVHSLVPLAGAEKELYDSISSIVKTVDSDMIILLESIASPDNMSHKVYYHTVRQEWKDLANSKGYDSLQEGIIIGMSSRILAGFEDNTFGIFCEANIDMPDSEAAAALIKALDDIWGFNVDYEKLKAVSTAFEEKLKTIARKSKNAQTLKQKNQMFYVG
ncbi:MAG: proteasome assembly chaperone family protein [Candidatus Woesearchaeota archaeon]